MKIAINNDLEADQRQAPVYYKAEPEAAPKPPRRQRDRRSGRGKSVRKERPSRDLSGLLVEGKGLPRVIPQKNCLCLRKEGLTAVRLEAHYHLSGGTIEMVAVKEKTRAGPVYRVISGITPPEDPRYPDGRVDSGSLYVKAEPRELFLVTADKSGAGIYWQVSMLLPNGFAARGGPSVHCPRIEIADSELLSQVNVFLYRGKKNVHDRPAFKSERGPDVTARWENEKQRRHEEQMRAIREEREAREEADRLAREEDARKEREARAREEFLARHTGEASYLQKKVSRRFRTPDRRPLNQPSHQEVVAKMTDIFRYKPWLKKGQGSNLAREEAPIDPRNWEDPDPVAFFRRGVEEGKLDPNDPVVKLLLGDSVDLMQVGSRILQETMQVG